jgi:hypothetical protein
VRLALPEPLRVDALRVDALRTDAYVESLIAGAEAPARPSTVPGSPLASVAAGAAVADPRPEPAPLDPDVAAVARLLYATVLRPHPSFRFEERVASRLAAVARGASPAAVGAGGAILAFPGVAPIGPGDPAASHAAHGRAVAPMAGIASAAVASAALSLGAAAVVAWRRGRPRRGIA